MDSRATFSKLGISVYNGKIDVPKRPRKYYTPLIHRTAAIAVLFLITLGLLGLVEYARQILPHSPWDVPTNSNQTKLNIRQESSVVGTTNIAATTNGNIPSPQSATTFSAASPIVSAYLDTTASTIIPSATSESAYLDTTAFTLVSSATPESYLDTTAVTITPSTSPGAYLDTTAFTVFPSVAPSAAPESYLDTTAVTILISASASAYLDTAAITTVATSPTSPAGSRTAGTVYLDTTKVTITATSSDFTASGETSRVVSGYLGIPSLLTIISGSKAASSTLGYLDTSTVSPAPSVTAPTKSSITPAASAAAISYLDISTFTTVQPMTSTSFASAYLNPADVTTAPSKVNNLYTTGPETASAPQSAYLDSSLFNTGTSTIVSAYIDPSTLTSLTLNSHLTPTITIGQVGSVTPSASLDTMIVVAIGPSALDIVQASGQPTPSEVKRPLVLITNMKYFYGAYLAVLIAVIFRITIGWLYSTTKMLEPFYMLKHKDGARAKDFFNINYLSANDTFEPYTAMLSGHWLMLSSSVLYALAGSLAPFASEMLHFYRSCEKFETGTIICGAALWINASVAWVIEGLLISICVLLIIVWSLLQSRASGVYSDPSSIASVCSLLHHPETIAELQRLDQCASKGAIVKNLSGKRFQLDTYQSTNGLERYGLIACGEYTDDELDSTYEPVATIDLHEKSVSKVLGISRHQHSLSRRIFYVIMESILPIVTAATLILVAYYYKDSSDDGYNRFMNSQGFGPRFLITGIGIIIHTQWNRLEREHSIFEPFRQLHTGHATPESTILISRSLFHVTSFCTSLYRRSFFVALIAFVAVIAEVLIIVLPGVPLDSGELARAFVISSYLSMAILALMLIVLAAIWLRPKGPDLPRKPNTLGALCLYLCDSQIRYDLADMAYMGKHERDYAVRDLEKEYALICGLGADGEIRWRVDYESHDLHE